MKYVNGDARPVTVVDEVNFDIEDTRSFGTYHKGGLCEKINLLEKLKFPSIEEQLSKRHSELMLVYKAVVCFYQNNSRLPNLFNEENEEEVIEYMKTLATKFDQKFSESNCRSVIKTCAYRFYPIIHMFAAILTLECVKCTGKYRPITSPFFFDCYNKFPFESKKKVEGEFLDIIDTTTLAKLVKLQYFTPYSEWGSWTMATRAWSSSTCCTRAPSPRRPES